MTYAVHLHNHTPHHHDGLSPIEIWSCSKNNYSFLQNAHPWGCPTYVLDPRLQDGHKIPKWEPRSRHGVYVGVSPLHASTVALVLNPNTNRLSPQFHCVFDDYFETIHHKGTDPPPIWEDLILKSRFCNEFEGDVDDTWEEKPSTNDVATPIKLLQQPDNRESAPSPLPDAIRPSSDEKSPKSPTAPSPLKESPSSAREPQKPLSPTPSTDSIEDKPVSPGPRRSSHVHKPVD